MWPLAEDLAEIEPARARAASRSASALVDDALGAYEEREEEFGEELMRALERHILLQIIDTRWKEHLHEMDYLREGIHLRGFAQIDPLVAYKNEGYLMFESLMDSIWEEYTRLIFHVNVELQPSEVEEQFGARRGARPTSTTPAAPRRTSPRRCAGRGDGRRRRRGGRRAGAAASRRAARPPTASGNAETVVKSEQEKIGRNDPCWCGCGQEVQEVPRRLTPVGVGTL